MVEWMLDSGVGWREAGVMLGMELCKEGAWVGGGGMESPAQPAPASQGPICFWTDASVSMG